MILVWPNCIHVLSVLASGSVLHSVVCQQSDRSSLQSQKVDESSDGQEGYLVRMLAAYLDLGGGLDMHGSSIKLQAQLKGLRLETSMDLDQEAIQSRGSQGASATSTTKTNPARISIRLLCLTLRGMIPEAFVSAYSVLSTSEQPFFSL